MRVLFDNFYSDLNKNNRLFTDDNTTIGDNLLSPMVALGKKATKRGLLVGTDHIIKKETADAIVFLDYPLESNENFRYGIRHRIPLYLITLESPIIKPEIFRTELHKQFIKVFTWSDYLISLNPEKNVKINYSYNVTSNFELGKRLKHLVIISGNKISRHSQELYSERLAIIDWYEGNHKDQLDLYGIDWDIKIMNNDLVGIIFNKINRTFKFFKINHPSYKGSLKRKAEVLAEYNFSLCFENASDFSGYITEKIFDSLMAGCIPIYRGAENITDYIPSNCFIDYRNFESIEGMYQYLNELSDDDIRTYQSNIKNFLSSPKVTPFTTDYFAETVITNITNNKVCS